MSRLADGVAALWAIARTARRVQAEQWLAPSVLAARRLERLRNLLARARRAPFYHAALIQAGVGDPAAFQERDLERLSLVDRQVIARHGSDAFLTRPPDGLFAVTTSGSTGTPGRFLRSRVEETEYSARWMRVYLAHGCGIRDIQVNLASERKLDRGGAVTLLRRAGVLPPVTRLAPTTPPAEVLARVQALAPPILSGYAGAIEALAEHVIATGAEVPRPRATFCTAMEVTDRCIELARRAFDAPVVDVYVTNEFGVIGWTCPRRSDVMHLNDDCFVIEVVDADGRPLPPGEVGELVVTGLGLRAMPLIRYRMGDMAARLPGACECGRGLALMSRVQGRTAHAIRRPDGGLIITPLITSLVGRAHGYEWIRSFQVREEPGFRLRVLVDARRPPTDAQRAELVATLGKGVGPGFTVALELVDRIPPAPSGKLQFLVPLARA